MDANFDLGKWKNELSWMVDFYEAQSKNNALGHLDSLGLELYRATMPIGDLFRAQKECEIFTVKYGKLLEECPLIKDYLTIETLSLQLKAEEVLDRLKEIDQELGFSKSGAKKKTPFLVQKILKGLDWATGDSSKIEEIRPILYSVCEDAHRRLEKLSFSFPICVPKDHCSGIEWFRKLKHQCKSIQNEYRMDLNERENKIDSRSNFKD